jgi:ankyrin repeat protein
VKLLLDRKALPNLRNDMGMGPLHFAAVRGNDDIVRLLLADPNVDVNLQCSNFFTPLEYAVASDHATIIRLLLERPDLELSCVKMARLAAGPASTGVPSEEFRMIMSRAEPDTLWGEVFREIQHKEDLTLMLLEKHAFDSKVYGRDPHKFAEEALCSAVGYGHFKILALLLDGGVDIEASRSLCTPLILAATAGNEAMVNILLDRGADAGVMRNGKLPFICAVKYGHLGVAQLLHRRAPDIDVNRRDAMGSTALSQATWYRRNSIVHWLLEECQADPNIGHFQFLTPIEIAAQCENNTAMVRAMLDKGATPNLKGHSGKALLNTDTVVGLLRAGANLRVGFSEWEPLLHWAVHKQEKRVLGTLLQRDDVRISHRDENGATPFWWAVFREYDEMVRLFLETEKDIALLVDGVSLPDYWVIRLYTVLERLGLALDYFDVL